MDNKILEMRQQLVKFSQHGQLPRPAAETDTLPSYKANEKKYQFQRAGLKQGRCLSTPQ